MTQDIHLLREAAGAAGRDNSQSAAILPHNQEAEQALLGCLILDNRVLEEVSEITRPDHFYYPEHKRIYEALMKVVDRGQIADVVTLQAYFEKDEAFKEMGGGTAYLRDLAESIPTTLNAKHYAEILNDLFLRRELIRIGRRTSEAAFDQNLDQDALACLSEAEASLYKLAESGQSESGFQTMKDAVHVAIEMAEKAYNSKGHVTGVTTGLRDLNKKLGGLQPSDLLILAARPSMGKTALAVNMAYSAAQAYADTGGKEGAVVAFFSLEMSADQLATRILSDVSEIPGDKIRRGDITKEDFRRFAENSGRLSQIPLYIDDTPNLSITAVRNRARRMQRRHGLGLLIVDYLQLLRGTGSAQSENRVLEISEITRGLKAIAKELSIPVLALSQLSRNVENREDKRPQLSDLRESGSIEQDADVVQFIYREEYYLERAMPDESDLEKMQKWQERMTNVHNVAEVIVAKQRHGPVGTVKLFFDGNYTRFSDLDQIHTS